MLSYKCKAISFLLLLICFNSSLTFSAEPSVKAPSFLSSSNALSTLSSNLKRGHAVVQLGSFWSIQGEAQQINVQYLYGNQYTLNKHQPNNGLFGFGYYAKPKDFNRFELAYGLNGFFLAKTGVGGDIIQEGDFTNLSYGYSVQHIPLYFDAKAIVKNNNVKYNVTFDAGIGPNFMRTKGYIETPLNNFTTPNNSFIAHNNAAFSATVGIGVRLNNALGKAPIECGYRFFYLGQGQLAINNNQLLNALKTGNNFANAVLCSLTV